MGEGQHFTVATLGFEQGERRLLHKVLAISEHRSPEFRSYAAAANTHPHIVLVNADVPQALRSWQKYQNANQRLAHLAAVFLSRAPIGGIGPYVLHRPILATRLFQLLERVITDIHGYRTPLAIDADASMVVLSADATLKPPSAGQPDGLRSADFVALVVDDSLPVRVQMKSALKTLATHVDFAETGEQGLELIEKRAYSIVFLDVILPGKDGYEVCRRIKKHPLQQRTPVVMLTGNTSPADRVKGRLAGCDTYLMKPVKQAVFEQLVAEFVRAHAAA